MSNLSIDDFADMTRLLQTMRDELTRVGIKELRTPAEVDAVLNVPTGTKLLVFNSVCGCAAGNARPGVALALQNKVIPDTLYTVFAGQDREATECARRYISSQPPSSPSIALFKDNRLVHMMHRYQIEDRDAAQIAAVLTAQFDAYCSTPGPSIPPDVFARLPFAQICGSRFGKPDEG